MQDIKARVLRNFHKSYLVDSIVKIQFAVSNRVMMHPTSKQLRDWYINSSDTEISILSWYHCKNQTGSCEIELLRTQFHSNLSRGGVGGGILILACPSVLHIFYFYYSWSKYARVLKFHIRVDLEKFAAQFFFLFRWMCNCRVKPRFRKLKQFCVQDISKSSILIVFDMPVILIKVSLYS